MARLFTALVAALVLFLAGAPPAAAAWLWPLRGEVITPYRNGDDPYARGQHRGIDIAGPVGAPVVTATPGVVRFAGAAGHSGLTVGVRTADGRYETSYLHLSSIVVHRGERVTGGQRLGAVGATGRRSAAEPHLHFGVRDAGSRHGYHDPLDFLPPAARPRPAPRRTPTPVGAPARPSPAPHPFATPQQEPSRLPRSAPAPRPAPALQALPGVHGVPVAVRHNVPQADPAPSPAPTRMPRRAPHAAPVPRRSPEAEAAAHGPDLAWAMVCAGLLLAAALMGAHAESDRGRAARHLPARLGALLRPQASRG
jgi:hypothetical protein